MPPVAIARSVCATMSSAAWPISDCFLARVDREQEREVRGARELRGHAEAAPLGVEHFAEEFDCAVRGLVRRVVAGAGHTLASPSEGAP